jgi:curved DNA-binding protein CbpA
VPPPPKDFYGVLGVSAHCTAEELKAAYKRRALATHPDKEGGSEAAFKALGEAHAVVSDANARAVHDADVRDWQRRHAAAWARQQAQQQAAAAAPAAAARAPAARR